MSDAAQVELVGGPQAAADMQRWAAQLAPEVAKASESFGQRVADLVRGRVPVLTGQLEASVDTQADDEGVEITMGDGVVYAGWIEFGGSRGRTLIPEGRYLYPTALAAQDEFAQAASDAASDTVSRFPWSTPTA